MNENVRLLRIRQVCERTGLSRSTVYELVSEHELPKPIQISARTVGWVESEIDSFIRSRIARSRAFLGGRSA